MMMRSQMQSNTKSACACTRTASLCLLTDAALAESVFVILVAVLARIILRVRLSYPIGAGT